MRDNDVIRLFLGDGSASKPSHLKFKTWYHPDISHYLLQMSDNQAQCIRIVFSDEMDGNNTQTFKDQLQTLIILGNIMQRNVIFISKEPGANNHFICGLVNGKRLLLINPLGITANLDCYKTLAELKQEDIVGDVWLSSNPLQIQGLDYEGDTLYSCGPITVELATHILSNISAEQLNDFWNNTLKAQEPTIHDASGLVYFGTPITNLLPDTLAQLFSSLSGKDYRAKILAIRSQHLEQLRIFPELLSKSKHLSVDDYLAQCVETPTQVLFNSLIYKNKQTDNIQRLPEYGVLVEELSKPIDFLRKIQLVKSKEDVSEIKQESPISIIGDLYGHAKTRHQKQASLRYLLHYQHYNADLTRKESQQLGYPVPLCAIQEGSRYFRTAYDQIFALLQPYIEKK